MAENNEMQAKWYVVHTYSGYENKVKTDLEKTIENRHLENEILEVRVPMQEVTEVKEGGGRGGGEGSQRADRRSVLDVDIRHKPRHNVMAQICQGE